MVENYFLLSFEVCPTHSPGDCDKIREVHPTTLKIKKKKNQIKCN